MTPIIRSYPLDYPSLNVLLFYQPPGYVHRPTIISKNEVICGGIFRTQQQDGRFKTIQTPRGTYDISPIVQQLPSSQQPDLVVVQTSERHPRKP